MKGDVEFQSRAHVFASRLEAAWPPPKFALIYRF